MKRSSRRKRSQRKRKTLLSILYTIAGVSVIAGFAWWLELHRDTDLTDPTEGITSTFKDTDVVAESPMRFQNVADALGISLRHGPGPRGRTLPEDTGSGIAWGDYDGDGDWDLYVVNFPGPLHQPADSTGYNRLFRNEGNRFTDITNVAGVGDPDGFGMGASFADYDDDGNLDLYVTNFGPNRLYRNRGDGTFEDVAAKAGVADTLWSTGVAWGDFDRDGHLDLYVCNYVDYDDLGAGPELAMGSGTDSYTIPFTLNPNSFDPQPNRLYRNRGDSTFEEIAEICGVDDPEGRSLGATACDLDGDGWLDLYVNNDVSTNRLYRNIGADIEHGPIFFADLSAITGTADPRGSMGLSVGEIGGMTGVPDGLPDLFITHWIAQENAFYQSVLTSGGDLEYRDKTRQFRLGETSLDMVGWGCALADFDLDGRPDIAVANGSTLEEREDPRYLKSEPVFLLWNDGKMFHDVASVAGEALSRKHWSRGLAVTDFDRDGDVDIAIAINRGKPLLLRNDTVTSNHSLVVTLSGRSSVCFGAKIEVHTNELAQTRWWGADVTFMGMHAAEMVFGLGETTLANKVQVKWADGKTTALTNIPAGRVNIVHPDKKSATQ